MGLVIRLSWLGHATVVLDLDGTRIITDPVLRDAPAMLRREGQRPRPADWAHPDAALVSHLHLDHADLPSLRRLGSTPILSSAPNVAWLRKRRLSSSAVIGNDWSSPVDGVEVRLVRADHRHRPLPHRPNAAHGMLLRGAWGVAWYAGDTSLHPEMFDLEVVAGGRIDLAVVPVGGWGPRLSPGHMDAREAAVAAARSGARWAVPVHWGTFHPPVVPSRGRAWFTDKGREFAAAVTTQAPRCRALVMAPGETCVVDEPATADEDTS